MKRLFSLLLILVVLAADPVFAAADNKEEVLIQGSMGTLYGVLLMPVDKEPSAPGVEGAINQTINIAHILKYVEFFLDMNKPKYVVIEAPAFNASGRVADLAGLNHAIRLACLQRNIKFYPLPPTTVKAATVGNGQATKEMMVQTWLKLFPEYSLLESMKVDDLADAWALCNFPVENCG